MTTTRTRFESAQKHLKLFEDSWRLDHEAAMLCRDFEEYIAEAVTVFALVDDLSQLRREYIYRGLEEPNAEIDATEQGLYARWLTLVEDEIEQLKTLERSFAVVEGSDRFRACIEKARSFLKTWAPAVPALALGSRLVDFSEEDADQIRALLNAPPGSPGRPCNPTRSVPKGDPSLLN